MLVGFQMGLISIKKLPLSVFAIILNLKPIFVMIIGVLTQIEKFTAKKLILILVSFLGTGLIVNPNGFAALWKRYFLQDKGTNQAVGSIDKGIKLIVAVNTVF